MPHPDDPRNYCHCGLLRKPVAECTSGKCKSMFPKPKPGRPWHSPTLLSDYGGKESMEDGCFRIGAFKAES